MDLLQHALDIATQSHLGQYDKAGKPYIEHPLYVSSQLETTDQKIVALLHDVIEDTDITIEDLQREGFSDNILEAIQLLTKPRYENYFDYIKRIKSNNLATSVKLEDLKHNMDLNRIDTITEKDTQRLHKYKKAYQILTE